MEPVLQKQTGPVELLHITTGDRLDSIMQKGILASEYGDLSVDDNDGAGIYAIRNETKILRDLINDYFFVEREDLFLIRFLYNGDFYECVGENLTEEDIEEMSDNEDSRLSRLGYIVIPGQTSFINPKHFISVERVTEAIFSQEQEKDSLASQIQQAKSKGTNHLKFCNGPAKSPER